MALVYIDRLITTVPTFVVNSHGIHRLLLISLLIAAKYYDDYHYNNERWAFIGGIPLKELNQLELEYCFLLRWNFSIDSNSVRIYLYSYIHYLMLSHDVYVIIKYNSYYNRLMQFSQSMNQNNNNNNHNNNGSNNNSITNNNSPTLLLLLCGLPGCGKTTIMNELQQIMETENISNLILPDHNGNIYSNISLNIHKISLDKYLFDHIRQSNNFNSNIWKQSRNMAYNETIKILDKCAQNFNNNIYNIIIIDDNMYYRSMRYQYYKLCKSC